MGSQVSPISSDCFQAEVYEEQLRTLQSEMEAIDEEVCRMWQNLAGFLVVPKVMVFLIQNTVEFF